MEFPDQKIVQIKNGNSFALFAPLRGGRLLKWNVEGHEVIHWPEDADWSNPRTIRGGNPLLFPFIARHMVNGQIGWWLDKDGIKREMPVHGFAHSLPFSHAVTADETGIGMVLQDNEQTRTAYPFRFRFEAAYRLAGQAMEVTLTTWNLDSHAMPYYAGHHFYFSLSRQLKDTTTLQLPANHRQTYRSDGTLSQSEAGKTSYCIGDPRLQDHFHILESQDQVSITTPEIGREIEIRLQAPGAIPWYAIGTWSERMDTDYYCVEPWLGLPNAIHHRQGLRWLQPGEKESAVCRIELKLSQTVAQGS